jgi:hypothetical protein
VAFYLWNEHVSIDVETGAPLEYKSNLEDFLGMTMRYLNSLDEHGPDMVNIRKVFECVMETACRVVVPYGGFRLPPKPGGNKRPINMVFFESFGYLLSRMTGYSDGMIKEAYNSLLDNEQYVHTLTHSVDSNVQIEKRYRIINETIERFKQ